MTQPLRVPESLRPLGLTAPGRAWLERLPELIRACADRWSLTLREPFDGGSVSLTMDAESADRGPVVVKIQYPHRESEHEADALAAWNGNGAVRILDHDPNLNAMLLERCRPGTPLHELEPEAALDVMVDLLPRLWIPAGEPFRTVADEARWWSEELPTQWERASRPFEPALLDAALQALDELPATQRSTVLVHQDLHAGNVLRSRREPWLAIDPKPLLGEREFGVAALVRGSELGHSRDAVLRRLDRVTEELGLDRERARRWTLAQTVAWAFEEDDEVKGQMDVARWLLEAD